MNNKKKKKNPFWFYLVLFALPLLLLGVLELSLRAVKYGTDYSTFVKISDQFPDYKFFNPAIPQKYFGNFPITPSVIADGFKEFKTSNTYRIFALGGSTTAGFPHPPNGSFPRLLKKLLQNHYPEHNFEVINLGISAVNTVTIRDIINDVIKESPDLIIFYAGHNEYYGALGPASRVSGSYDQVLLKIILSLKEFRTFQLIEDIISRIRTIFSEHDIKTRTLMSEIAGNTLIPKDSEIYHEGIEQFKQNLEYIVGRSVESKVPILLGTLASNLLQQPLCRFAGCDSLFERFSEAEKLVSDNKKVALLNIKENDQLRFRAPEKMNEIIFSTAEKFNIGIFDVKKIFEGRSTDGIIGYNLMLDHLHPTLEGNQLIAAEVFNIIKFEQLTAGMNNIKNEYPNVMFSNKLPTYTKLDSAFTMFRLTHLLADFPFSAANIKIDPEFKLSTIADTIAYQIVNGEMSWENAHLKLAEIYFERGEFIQFISEINVLIEDKPFDKFPYLEAVKMLEKVNKPYYLLFALQKYFRTYPELFAARKIADIYFKLSKYKEAIDFYEFCASSIKNEPIIYYNLSSSYFELKNLKKALYFIEKCIEIDQDYPNARKISEGLRQLLASRNN